MYRYAKESGIAQYNNHLGRAILTIGGNSYGFDHWEIDDNNDGTETVNVYIFCVDHLMSGKELLRLEHLADTWRANQNMDNILGC
jgi:hypothetical protein